MTNPVFLTTSLDTPVVVLDGPEGRHAATVRRTRVGEVVDLVDGRGLRCTGAVTATGPGSITVSVTTRLQEPEPSPRFTLVQALAKGDRAELAVELATELGVDVIVPWQAARSVARWDGERGRKALERWRSTAREAAKQSRRAWFPAVLDPVETGQISSLPGRLLVLHEVAHARLAQLPVDGDVVLVVGPEGGLTDDEVQVLTAGGGAVVRLGDAVLRTSTAGAAALAVLSSRAGRW